MAVIGAAFLAPLLLPAQELPARLGDGEFRSLRTGLSETGGRFPGQVMSNEDSALFYVSNVERYVERYLFDQGQSGMRFYENVASARRVCSFVR